MTMSKLDPRTAAAEKRMVDAVLRSVPPTTPSQETEAMCDDLLKKADAAE